MALLDSEIKKKSPLGRGLASLIPDAKVEGGLPGSQNKKDYFVCDIEKIVPNTYQPRKIFQKEALEELTESIKLHGIIQPLTCRWKDGRLELIAGERRWRAAQKAGLKQVPVVIRDVPEDQNSLELAIIENIQREDLNCIEEAIAYQQLMDEFQLSQEQIAERVGKGRTTVANTLRLLKLPAVIREDIASGALTMGHARALLSLESADEQLEIRDQIIKKKLSVRDTERQVSQVVRSKNRTQEGTAAGTTNTPDVHLKNLEDDLRRVYGTPVRIMGNMEKGTIQITYATREDLMRLADKLKQTDAEQK
jgi:ParB family chromosome partitioning protein